jgi:hypothetical protein
MHTKMPNDHWSAVDPETGVLEDYINGWNAAYCAAAHYEKEPLLPAEEHLMFQPKPTYEKYVEERFCDPEAILEKSDPAKVAAIDQLVEEFNAERGKMFAEHNIARALDFFNAIERLVRGTHASLL